MEVPEQRGAQVLGVELRQVVVGSALNVPPLKFHVPGVTISQQNGQTYFSCMRLAVSTALVNCCDVLPRF